MAHQDQFVWYAAFGSNLSRERFLAYLRGGVVAGSSKVEGEAGARDPSPPIAEDWRWLDHRLFFGHRSQRWHHRGVAFLDPQAGSGRTMARLYKITVAQFEDVHQQEVRADTLVPLDLEKLVSEGALEVYDRLYGLALYLGAYADQCPIVTITSARLVAPNDPAPEYLQTLVRGLRDYEAMTDADIVAYLMRAPGIEGVYDQRYIAKLMKPSGAD